MSDSRTPEQIRADAQAASDFIDEIAEKNLRRRETFFVILVCTLLLALAIWVTSQPYVITKDGQPVFIHL